MSKEREINIAIISNDDIKNKIYTIRGMQVMLDSDLAEVYGYETKTLNQQVKRNIEKFPSDFMFRLTEQDVDELSRSQNVTTMQKAGMKGGRVYLPFVFSEQGIYMLMTILKSDLATSQSIKLIRAFREMRHFIANNSGIFQRLDKLESSQIEFQKEASDKFNKIFKQLEASTPGNAAIFFMGTFYDAKSFVRDLVVKANEGLVLIDDYVSKATLDILRGRKDGVSITIYTTSKPRNKDRLSENEIKDFNNQYGKLEVKSDNTFHDRFLIIDNKELYSIGASLKDAGSKTFAINKMENPIFVKAILDHFN